jgi:hypothetical protein
MNDQQTQHPKSMIYKTENGCVLSNAGCTVIQLEFGNLFLRFDLAGLEGFQTCIEKMDLEKSISGNMNKPYHRKVFVALQPSGITMAFHPEEVAELKELLNGAKAILMLKKLSHAAMSYPKN